jgi:hypothetical protein
MISGRLTTQEALSVLLAMARGASVGSDMANPPARCVKATQVNVGDNWLPLLQCIYLRSDSMTLVL